MSVVFTTISNKFIAMCADKQRFNSATGTMTEDATKIEKWSTSVAVGMSGDLTLGEYIRSTIHRYITEMGIQNFGIEEIGDLFIQSYHTAVKNAEVSFNSTTKFIIAGQFSDNKTGAVVIKVSEDKSDKETYETANVPATLILEPEDLSAQECNILLGKALKNVEGKYLKNPLESIHRRAVRNVSEHSKITGKESDYILITL